MRRAPPSCKYGVSVARQAAPDIFRSTGEPAGVTGYHSRFSYWKIPIRYQQIAIAGQRKGQAALVHRYQGTRPWSVAALAAAAAAGAVVLTGGVSEVLRHPRTAIHQPAEPPVARPVQPPAPRPAAIASAAERPPGSWQVQVGAFRRDQAARQHVESLAAQVPGLADLPPLFEQSGPLTRARIGGIEDEAGAGALCGQISLTGSGCFVVAPDR